MGHFWLYAEESIKIAGQAGARERYRICNSALSGYEQN
jgi:hypothetical protein